MERVYDLFEKDADGSPLWKTSGAGHENAIHELQELAETTSNECFVMHLPTKAVIASMNVPNGNDLKQKP
jgi:hypothetical protein